MASLQEALAGDKLATQVKVSSHAPGDRAMMSETIIEDGPVEGEAVIETPFTEIETIPAAAPSRPAPPSRKGLPGWAMRWAG